MTGSLIQDALNHMIDDQSGAMEEGWPSEKEVLPGLKQIKKILLQNTGEQTEEILLQNTGSKLKKFFYRTQGSKLKRFFHKRLESKLYTLA